ncbi:MAG TPA: TonB-dependent siderophore receptor [Micropepsaceae bacterium]|nr:TonB-dependent siderophore receptor [Micropepsaceae bacterium]
MNFSLRRCIGVPLRASLLAGSGLGLLYAFPAAAQTQTAAASPQQTEQVLIEGQRPMDYAVQTPSVPKLTEPLVDTPQSIDTISEQLLKDRAVTNLNDAFRSVPSITIGAGEFKSLGNSPTIRGFVARTDMFIDGQRDIGDYFRDPFNMEEIQVLEGPASILFGRGSTGGVINQVSKLPSLNSFISGTLTAGTDLTRRATVDINEPLPDLGPGAAFRITAMGHDAKVAGRNVAEASRYGFAPSLALGLGTPTRLTLSYFHQSADDVPDYGLPYFGTQPAHVPRQNFYGFTSDYMKTGTDIVTAKVEHDFLDGITVRNQLRYAYYSENFRFTEPLIATSVPLTTPLSAVMVTRNVNSGNGVQTMLWDQADATVHFDTGFVEHTLVAGIEGGHETTKPEFDNSTGVPSVPLLAPDPHVPFTATSTFPRFKTDTGADSFAAYALDTLKFGPQWELSGGVRWDYFGLDYKDQNFSTTTPGLVTRTDHIPQVDRMFSYRGALVYKLETNANVYFSYGTSFNPSGEELSFVASSRSFNLSNVDLSPEKNQNFEAGTKWDLFNNHLALTGAIFRSEKQNARIPDPTNSILNVLGGDFRVDGFELGATGRITENWQIQAGYSYLDGHVVKSGPGAAPVGSPLMNTPKDTFTVWTTYVLGEGFEIGGGGRYVSSQYTQNVPPTKTVPSYWTFDVMGKYALSEKMSLQLNVNNVFDKYYYDQLHFFHVVPGPGRTALLSVNFNY